MSQRAVTTELQIDAPWGLVALGAASGVAWAASLRGLMAALAGAASTVEWSGTFLQILAPAAIVGGLYGWAEYLRRFHGPAWRRWFALSPLVFALAGFVGATSWNDVGGALVAAFGLTLFAAAGGVALAGAGPRWLRVLAALVALAPIVVFIIVMPSTAGPAFALVRPRGSWLVVYFIALLAVLCVAGSIPFRRSPRDVAE